MNSLMYRSVELRSLFRLCVLYVMRLYTVY